MRPPSIEKPSPGGSASRNLSSVGRATVAYDLKRLMEMANEHLRFKQLYVEDGKPRPIDGVERAQE